MNDLYCWKCGSKTEKIPKSDITYNTQTGDKIINDLSFYVCSNKKCSARCNVLGHNVSIWGVCKSCGWIDPL